MAVAPLPEVAADAVVPALVAVVDALLPVAPADVKEVVDVAVP